MKPTIPNIIFVVLFAILTIWLTFLTTKGGLTNNSYKRWHKKLTRRGKIVGFVLLFMTVLLVAQEINNKNLGNNKDYILNKERNQRDADITKGIKAGVDSSSNKLYNDISKAFSNQELKIDTINKTIINLKNANRATNNYVLSEKEPTLTINTFSGIKIEKDFFYLEIESEGAGSTNYNIDSKLLIEYKNGEYHFKTLPFFSKESKITTKATINARIISNPQNIKEIYFYMKGSYSNLSLTKNYNVDYLVHYNPQTKFAFGKLGREKNKIINIMNSFQNKDN